MFMIEFIVLFKCMKEINQKRFNFFLIKSCHHIGWSVQSQLSPNHLQKLIKCWIGLPIMIFPLATVPNGISPVWIFFGVIVIMGFFLPIPNGPAPFISGFVIVIIFVIFLMIMIMVWSIWDKMVT